MCLVCFIEESLEDALKLWKKKKKKKLNIGFCYWEGFYYKRATVYVLASFISRNENFNVIYYGKSSWSIAHGVISLQAVPSPVTISPSLKLCLGISVVRSNSLNFSIPERNSGLIWLLFRLMFFSTSSLTVGGGSLKARKPGKKRRMLSATSWFWSKLDEPWSLNTFSVKDTITNTNWVLYTFIPVQSILIRASTDYRVQVRN